MKVNILLVLTILIFNIAFCQKTIRVNNTVECESKVFSFFGVLTPDNSLMLKKTDEKIVSFLLEIEGVNDTISIIYQDENKRLMLLPFVFLETKKQKDMDINIKCIYSYKMNGRKNYMVSALLPNGKASYSLGFPVRMLKRKVFCEKILKGGSLLDYKKDILPLQVDSNCSVFHKNFQW